MRNFAAGFAPAGLAFLPLPSLAQRAAADDPASPQALQRLDAYAQGVTAAGQFSGVVLVAKNGAVVFERAYGLRDERTNDDLRIDTRFDLASAGKMFTAAAVLQQITGGQADLDDQVRRSAS